VICAKGLQGHMGSKILHQQNPAVLNRMCWLTQVDLYNDSKMVVVVTVLQASLHMPLREKFSKTHLTTANYISLTAVIHHHKHNDNLCSLQCLASDQQVSRVII